MNGKLRVALLAAGGLAGLLGGFAAPRRGDLQELYGTWGFTGIFLTLSLWAVSMWGLRPETRQRFFQWWRENFPALLLALLCMVAAFFTAPPKFRIQYDESNLAGIAFTMYQRHEIWMPQNGYYTAGNYTDLLHSYDKRPLTYPFTVYLLHALTGYRIQNSFVVNFIAGCAALFLFFLLLRRWLPPPFAYGGMLLLAAYPLFVLWSSSAGFEIVNLAWLIAAALLLDSLARKRDAATCAAFVTTLAVLAQCRYESSLFFLVGVILGGALLPRKQWTALPWWLCLLPLALMPLAWQQVLFMDPSFHQLDHGGPMFSSAYFLRHVGRAWVALSGMNKEYMALPLVLYLALAGLMFYVPHAARQGRWKDSRHWGLALFGLAGYGLVSAVQFSYHMGDLTTNITARLGVIYLPVLAGFAAWLFYVLATRWRHAGAACVTFAVVMACWSWPYASTQEVLKTLNTTRYYELVVDYLKTHEAELGRNILVIAERGHPLVLRGYGGLNFAFANDNVMAIKHFQSQRLFQTVLAVQEISLQTGQPLQGSTLNPAFKLEPLYEEQLNVRGFVRVSRVVPPYFETP